MENIYYVDRPPVPPTQQVIIRLDSLLEHAVYIDTTDISRNLIGRAVEVKDVDGDLDGVLVYFPGDSYADLTGGEDLDDDEVLGGEGVDVGTPDDGVDPNTAEEVSNKVDIDELLSSSADDILNYLREEHLLNLELELSAAKQQVQDIEDEIADEEGALD